MWKKTGYSSGLSFVQSEVFADDHPEEDFLVEIIHRHVDQLVGIYAA